MTANDYMNVLKRVADFGTMENLVGAFDAVKRLSINDRDINANDFNKIVLYYKALSNKKVEEMQNEQK